MVVVVEAASARRKPLSDAAARRAVQAKGRAIALDRVRVRRGLAIMAAVRPLAAPSCHCLLPGSSILLRVMVTSCIIAGGALGLADSVRDLYRVWVAVPMSMDFRMEYFISWCTPARQ